MKVLGDPRTLGSAIRQATAILSHYKYIHNGFASFTLEDLLYLEDFYQPKVTYRQQPDFELVTRVVFSAAM